MTEPNYKNVSFNCPLHIADKLEEATRNGMRKTAVINQALARHFDEGELKSVKEKLVSLETKVDRLLKALSTKNDLENPKKGLSGSSD